MHIGITLSKNAYTPEAYAYEKYLKSLGHYIQLDYALDPNNDINIYFMGSRPFWKKKEGKALEIHEYQSLSTPPYARLKNYTKKIINRKPSGRIFLNDIVYDEMLFCDDIPYIYRDMGVDEAFFQKISENPTYDILYCGSVSGRKGLIDILINLSKKYKVIVVGKICSEEKEVFLKNKIDFLGKLSRNELPEIYRNARFGLNYTPNIYPYNIQTSTKTLEYLASGLRVISNKYAWSSQFNDRYNSNFIWINNEGEIINDNFNIISNYSYTEFMWNNVLESSNFEKFLGSFLK